MDGLTPEEIESMHQQVAEYERELRGLLKSEHKTAKETAAALIAIIGMFKLTLAQVEKKL